MKVIVLRILLFLCPIYTVYAQDKIDFSNYTPLKCQGPIPQDFKTELSKLVEQAKNERNTEGRKEKKQEVEFAELSNYQLNNILFSGKVLYGDILTGYVNKVADVILKEEPELRNKIRFYVLKTTDLNAYSTQRGIIFVSVGLLAEIESEAQLAFILCHELVHFRNNHNLESYKKRQDIGEENDINVSERLSRILNYGKEHELEADREGLELFLKTPYSTNELNNLFDVMLYSYLPFDEIKLDSAYFNSGTRYVLPGKYFPKEVSDITAEEDVADSMSTHPNIKRRREAIRKLLETDNKPSGSSFILTKEEFTMVQRAARCELSVIYLQEAEFEEAFYCGFLLEKIYGKDLFSTKIRASALYGVAKQKNHDHQRSIRRYIGNRSSSDDESKESWELVEGESQAVYHMFRKMPSKELAILGAKTMLESYRQYNDDFFEERFRSLVYELVSIHELERSSFIEEPSASDTVKKVEVEDTVAAPAKLSKISKIKKSKAEKSGSEGDKSTHYYKYAFAGHLNDSLFIDAFTNSSARYEREKDRESSPAYRRYQREREDIVEKYGEALDIKKFVMLNPFYSSYILKYYFYHSYRTKNPKVTPLMETAIEQKLQSYFRDYAKQLEIDLDIVGMSQQSNLETEQFNDYQQLINWFSERLAIGKMGAYIYNDQYIKKYANEYGYMALCYVINVDKSMEVVFMLFDLETGGSRMVYEKDLKKAKPDGVFSRMIVYDILHQIKQKPHRINKLKRKHKIDEE